MMGFGCGVVGRDPLPPDFLCKVFIREDLGVDRLWKGMAGGAIVPHPLFR